MAVYVDTMRASYGRMVMCHMVADSRAELDAMADQIGVARKWIQHEGTHLEHYDIALTKKRMAVRCGAKEVTMRGLMLYLRERRKAALGTKEPH